MLKQLVSDSECTQGLFLNCETLKAALVVQKGKHTITNKHNRTPQALDSLNNITKDCDTHSTSNESMTHSGQREIPNTSASRHMMSSDWLVKQRGKTDWLLSSPAVLLCCRAACSTSDDFSGQF